MFITDDRSRHNFQNTASFITELERLMTIRQFNVTSVKRHICLQLTIKSSGMTLCYWMCSSGCFHSVVFMTYGTRERWVVSFMSRSLCLWEKNLRYQINGRIGEPHSQSGSFGEEKSLVPARNWTQSPCSDTLKIWAVKKCCIYDSDKVK
jgi:hypothetical protein